MDEFTWSMLGVMAFVASLAVVLMFPLIKEILRDYWQDRKSR